MFCPYRVAAPLIALLVLCFVSPLLREPLAAAEPQDAKKQESASKFLRLVRDEKGKPTSLETAVTRYVPSTGEAGVVVDLVSAVHIGERAYYRALNKQMQQYDVVLYELVAAPGTRIPKGGRSESDNPLSFIQQIVKSMLNLELQTEQIDYTMKNFVHADLSPEKMMENIRGRGEDGLTLFLSIAADLMRQANLEAAKRPKTPPKGEDIELDLFSLLFDAEAPAKLKRLLAQHFEELESLEAGLGQTLSTILIADRNKAAMQVFQKELAGGKKKIAIFYGAAHMPDYEKRLREEFGMKKESEQWLEAWDLEKGR